MTIHKRACLTPIQRREIFDKYFNQGVRICDLCRQYSVTRPTIYRALERGRQKDSSVHKSVNKRFRCLEYGLKRLSKIEAELEKKLKTQYSAANFLKQVLEECPYTIETWYTDNGTEYKGNPKTHASAKLCQEL